jgi:hypothetical protein
MRSVGALLVGFSAVTDGRNIDPLLFIENCIDDPVVTDANAPEVFLAGQLASPVRARNVSEGFYLGKDAANDRGVEDFQFVPS